MDLPLPPPIVVEASPRIVSFSRNETGTIFRGPIEVAVAPTPAFSPAALTSLVTVVGASWSAVSGVRFVPAATAGVDDPNDGHTTLVVHTSEWPATFPKGAVAQTVLRVAGDGSTREGDVHLNAFEYRFDITREGDWNYQEGTIDLRGILAHELGHVLGLGHSEDGTATMYAAYPTSRPFAWRSLEEDDRNGASTLYPGSGDGGCIIHACPTGFLCTANRCEEVGALATSCTPCFGDGLSCDGAGKNARCRAIPDAPNALSGSGVCARECTTNSDCGDGMCLPTSEAGDFRCVSDCTKGPAACGEDSTCAHYGPQARCVDGACLFVGEIPADAGADAGPQNDGGAISHPSSKGCSAVPSSAAWGAAPVFCLLAVMRWLRRGRNASSCKARRERPCELPPRRGA